MSIPAEPSTGFCLYSQSTGKEVKLAMQMLWLSGEVLPVGARLAVRHVFRSQESTPVEAIYAFALPRDASLRRFRITGEGFVTHSELKPVKEAQAVYEEGIVKGHLSALARTYGDGVVNLSVGNIRPGEEVTVFLEIIAGVELHDNGLRFRFPFTLAPTYHSKARAVHYGDGTGEIELPEDEFDDMLLPTWHAKADGLHQVGFDLNVSMSGAIDRVSSPSHALQIHQPNDRLATVGLAIEADVPNRDLVLDVRTREDLSGTFGGPGGDGKQYFATVIASSRFGQPAETPRRIAFLLDRSGSMQGKPLQHAVNALRSCLGTLTANDEFGIVAFDDKTERFQHRTVKGTAENRESASAFLNRIDARGGTELLAGLQDASALLGGEGGEVFLLTDGQVSGGEVIVAETKKACLRVYCLGIGSASQDRFLLLLARETGGLSRFLTPRERVDLAAIELFASAGRPLARDVACTIEGVAGAQIHPAPPKMVFAGAPVVLFGSYESTGRGELRIAWSQEAEAKCLTIPLALAEEEAGETVRLAQGARLITDIEARYLPGETAVHGGNRKEADRVAHMLEVISRDYGLASREMALVAVVERLGDVEGQVPKTSIVPVGMPQDTEFSAYFGMAAGVVAPGAAGARSVIGGLFDAAFRILPAGRARVSESRAEESALPSSSPDSPDDTLVELSGRLEPDGGLSGRNIEERVLASLIALLAFQEEGSTTHRGTFSAHMRRLLAFLRDAESSLGDAEQSRTVLRVIEAVEREQLVPGSWVDMALDHIIHEHMSAKESWREISARAGLDGGFTG